MVRRPQADPKYNASQGNGRPIGGKSPHPICLPTRRPHEPLGEYFLRLCAFRYCKLRQPIVSARDLPTKVPTLKIVTANGFRWIVVRAPFG